MAVTAPSTAGAAVGAAADAGSQAAYLAAMQKLQTDSNQDTLIQMQTTATLNRNGQLSQAVGSLDAKG